MTDETEFLGQTRRGFLAGAGTGIATAVGPLQSSSSNDATSAETLTKLATTYHGLANTEVGKERAVEHGGQPSWTVDYTEGHRDSLIEWVDAKASRQLLTEHQPSQSATVVGSPVDIGTEVTERRSGRGLQGKQWIELIDLDIELGLAEPIATLETALSDSGVGLNWRERVLLSIQSAVPETAVLAFDGDANAVEPADLRGLLEADTETVRDVDTSGLTIAVVDTGFNPAGGAVLGDPSEDDSSPSRLLPASKSVIDDRTVAAGLSAVEDGNGHGSVIASQILGTPAEVADGLLPAAELLAIRAVDDEGRSTTSHMAEGVRYAADQGADLVCLGVGSGVYSAGLDRALAYAVQEGTIPVAPVGNNRQRSRWITSPATSIHAISVAAVSGDPPADAKSAYFSSLGPHPGTTDFSTGLTAGATPDVAAPGMKLSTQIGQSDGSTTTVERSGTSLAAANAVGVIGLLLAADSSLRGDIEAVRHRLRASARPIPNAGTTEVGAGMVNAHTMLTETETADQLDVMTDSARSRDEAYVGLSRQQTGLLSFIP